MLNRLTTFGPPVVCADGLSIPLPSERRFQLLAYLASRARWVPRDEIVVLFWAEHDAAAARRNLRRLLFDLRQLPWLEGLESEGDAVRWRVDSDRQAFEGLLVQRSWGPAMAVVRGTFLDGMENGASAAFAQWLQFDREWLLDRWRDAVCRHLAALQHDPAQVAEIAQAAAQQDPLNERWTLAIVQARFELGDPNGAKRAADAYGARLARDLGVEPSVQMRARIEGLRLHHSRAAPLPRAAALPPATGFVGRRIELRELAAMLARDDCRSVTLLGPGGIGKSSLAGALLADAAPGSHAHRYWIELQNLTTIDELVARLADACGVALRGEVDGMQQVLARLADAPRLLVFDNCEHLAGIGALVARIGGACPGTRILATSRTRLGASGEWVFPLSGLPVPDADEPELAVLRAFDSVRLFEARAFAVAPQFELGAHAADVRALVRAVDGLPLAIELAAACVRLMPVGEILAELSRSIAVLEAGVGTTPGAGPLRSLRASFEHSWRLLSADEKRVLPRLSVLSGEFDRCAAQQVGGASLPLLAALADKSLVGARGNGRFLIHPVVAQCAREYLDDPQAVLALHAAHFAGVLSMSMDCPDPALRGGLEHELPHCIDAWRWAAENANEPLIARMAEPLGRVFAEKGRCAEGIALLARVELHGSDDVGERARAAVLRAAARLQYHKGDLALAEQSARASLRLCSQRRDRRGIKESLNTLALTLDLLGRRSEARRCFERGLAYARADDDRAAMARLSNGLAILEKTSGRYARARSLYEDLVNLHRTGGNAEGLAKVLCNLGNLNKVERRMTQARANYEEGLAVSRTHGLAGTQLYLQVNLGLLELELGQLDTAERLQRTALRDIETLGGAKQMKICALLALVRIAIARNDAEAGREPLRDALACADEMGAPTMQLVTVMCGGEWLAAGGEVAAGAALLAFAAGHPNLNAADASGAAALIDGMRLSESDRKRAADTASATTLGGAIALLRASTAAESAMPAG